jgi:thiamine pyrophosphate-dependent acetolactate synthase large subunit-like protein
MPDKQLNNRAINTNAWSKSLSYFEIILVSDIFGVTGDALNTLLEAIRKDSRFRWIGVRHEENAAYAAYAQAELSGGLGVCAGTVGPGSLHLINGLYNAKKEGAAVLAIAGQVRHLKTHIIHPCWSFCPSSAL